MGDAQMSSGMYASAERSYLNALELSDGMDADLHYNLGQAQMQQGKAGDAAYSFYWASTLNPSVEAYTSLAEAQLSSGITVSADRAMQNAFDMVGQLKPMAAEPGLEWRPTLDKPGSIEQRLDFLPAGSDSQKGFLQSNASSPRPWTPPCCRATG
jgi:tetratricopeptide (TPR) repeat protein